jgi:uncharacterized protein (DUF2236 family)
LAGSEQLLLLEKQFRVIRKGFLLGLMKWQLVMTLDSMALIAMFGKFMVHCAFTDSFLTAYRELGDDEDRSVTRYVEEWAKSAEPLGLSSAPKSDSELTSVLDDFLDNEIEQIEATRQIVHFIIHPPFSKAAMPFYRTLCNAAISTMDLRVLRALGLKPKSRIWLKIVKPLLRALQAVLGDESPSQTIARQRIARLTSTHE